MFLGANTHECESSRKRKFPGQFAPGNESSREREGQGAKVPGSELARVLLADLLHGANWPGSEKAVNHFERPVSQGSVLGPLLFLNYINDLPDFTSHFSTTRLFADDTILY